MRRDRRRRRSSKRRGGKLPAWLKACWPNCEHCAQPISLRRAFSSLVHREELTFPFRMLDGEREELPVRWLCGGCRHRAARIRQEAADVTA